MCLMPFVWKTPVRSSWMAASNLPMGVGAPPPSTSIWVTRLHPPGRQRAFSDRLHQNKAGRHVGNGLKACLAQCGRRRQLVVNVGRINEGNEDRCAGWQAVAQKLEFFHLLWGDFNGKVLEEGPVKDWPSGGTLHRCENGEHSRRRASRRSGILNCRYLCGRWPGYLRQQGYEYDGLPGRQVGFGLRHGADGQSAGTAAKMRASEKTHVWRQTQGRAAALCPDSGAGIHHDAGNLGD